MPEKPTGKEVEMDSRQVSASEEQTKWVTTRTIERGGRTVFDGVLRRETYEPLISEEGEPIPNVDPAPGTPVGRMDNRREHRKETDQS